MAKQQLTRAEISCLNIKDKCKYYGFRNDLMSEECATSFYCTKEESISRNKSGEITNDTISRTSHKRKAAQ